MRNDLIDRLRAETTALRDAFRPLRPNGYTDLIPECGRIDLELGRSRRCGGG